MKGCVGFLGIAVVIFFFAVNPVLGIIFLVLWLIVMAAVSMLSKDKKEVIIKQDAPAQQPVAQDQRLPYPGDGYSYYELVGMQYRGLNDEHMGIHTDAVAVAEYDNPHDPNAVSIRLANKVVAYIPREHNKPLHDYLHENGGVAPAHYRIWYHNYKYYGVAYIKDNGINQTYY